MSSNLNLDEIFNEVSLLTEDKIELFITTCSLSQFNVEQVEQIYLAIKEDLDVSVINNCYLTPFVMNVSRELLNLGYRSEHLKTLYTYDKEVVDRVIRFYLNGINIIPLMELEDSGWYIDFLLRCCEERFNLDVLKNKGLSYSNIYNLANCIVLGYDVEKLLEDLNLIELTSTQIIRYFVKPKEVNNVYVVESYGCMIHGDDLSYSIIAPNERDAKLISCINGEFNAFDAECKEYKVDGSYLNIIHTETERH